MRKQLHEDTASDSATRAAHAAITAYAAHADLSASAAPPKLSVTAALSVPTAFSASYAGPFTPTPLSLSAVEITMPAEMSKSVNTGGAEGCWGLKSDRMDCKSTLSMKYYTQHSCVESSCVLLLHAR